MSRLRCIQVGFDGPELITETCHKCKTLFAMSMPVYQAAIERREDMIFFCPNGHEQHYTSGESEESKLRRERDRAVQEQARLAENARQEKLAREAAEEQRDKAFRSLKRHKKRAAAGTCPCCKRTFNALAEHMKRQHPTFVAKQGAKVVPIKRVAS